MKSKRRRIIYSWAVVYAIVAIVALLPSSCTGGGGAPHETRDANDVADAAVVEIADATTEEGCPFGQGLGPGNTCIPLGIQGCAERFHDGSGLCRPDPARCSEIPGSIPVFDEGCVHVGIQECVDEFKAEGVCIPRMAHCATKPGTIPRFNVGCVPVGVSNCHPGFLRNGVCRPDAALCDAEAFPTPQDGCVPLDGPSGCGDPPWGPIQDDGKTIFVDAVNGHPDGDGSASKPLASIEAALLVVPEGGRIALAAGTYPEPVLLDRSVSLVGRCAAMVTVIGSGPTPADLDAVVLVTAPNVTVAHVRVAGDAAGIVAGDAPNLRIANVLVDGATRKGIYLSGSSTADIEATHIRGTKGGGTDISGRGLEVRSGAKVRMVRSAITGTIGVGVLGVGAGVEMTLVNVWVHGSRPANKDETAYGIRLERGARLVCEDSVIEDNTVAGIALVGRASDSDETLPKPVAAITRSVLAGHVDRVLGDIATGCLALSGEVSITDSVVVENAGVGLYFSNLPDMGRTVATVERTLVRNTVLFSGNYEPACGGVWAINDVSLKMNDVVIANNQGGGVLVAFDPRETGTSPPEIELRRALIEGTTALPQIEAHGLLASNPGLVTIEDCMLVDNEYIGIALFADTDRKTVPRFHFSRSGVSDAKPSGISGKGGSGLFLYGTMQADIASTVFAGNAGYGIMVSAAPVPVRISRSRLAGNERWGIVVNRGSVVDLDRNLITNNRTCGVAVGDAEFPTNLVATGNVVNDTRTEATDEPIGSGFCILSNSVATLENNAIVGNTTYGLAAYGPSTTFASTHDLIADTRTDDHGNMGLGALVQYDVSGAFRGSVIQDNRVAGVRIYNAECDIQGTLIRRTRDGQFSEWALEHSDKWAGDGVIVTSGSTVSIRNSRVGHNARAGLIFDDSGGLISGVHADDNLFGVVLQGDPRPEFGEDNVLENNGQDLDTEGELPVPTQPAPIPAMAQPLGTSGD